MQITFLPMNIKYHTNPEENLLSAAASAGVFIDGNCGGKGTCGKCKVKILTGELAPLTKHERESLTEDEIISGMRLACKVFIESDMVVQVPVSKHATLRKTKLTYLPEDFFSEKREGYGIAYDIGTTTVVAMLWDLEKGLLLDTAAKTNPQSVYGADVISRINFCGEALGNIKLVQQKIIDCLNEMTKELLCSVEADGINIKKEELVDMVAVGNTTMSHLLLGINPETLATAPFLPAFTGSKVVKGKELGLLVGESLTILPNIAGHVGSDIVAGILSARLETLGGNNLSIDIGTNGEIALFHEGKTYVCSTAAGPAFEGAAIRYGMRAASGAIETVHIENGKVCIDTIDGEKAVGICGSGLIDAVAQLLEAGVLDRRGRMLDSAGAEANRLPRELIHRLRKSENINEFVLEFGGLRPPVGGADPFSDIVLTQKDIREVQLAKGAIRAGITCLLNQAGITFEELDRVILAGAFGNYINKKSALRIGMLPQIPLEKIITVGNAAGSGASMALLSLKEREAAYEISEKAIHVDLSTHPDFQDEFLKSMFF